MIASLNPPVEKEESNRDLHLKSAGFQMHKMRSILLNWKSEIWTQHLPTYLIQYTECLAWKAAKNFEELFR